jgi:hypothetical protein
LLEAGGLAEPEAHDARPLVGGHRESGVHGIARQRQWDALATVEAPELDGDEVSFEVLPDRTLLVADETGDASVAPLADAVERELDPPYRARGVRQARELWAVAARRIEAVRLPGRAGEALELSVRGGERELVVDGAREFGTVAELEGLAGGRFSDYAVRAERLDGDWWEVRVDPL